MSATLAAGNHQLAEQTPSPIIEGAASKNNWEYDDFYTPSNELFYNSNQYSKLNQLKQETRLLKSLSINNNKSLKTELINSCFLSSSHSNRPKYLANFLISHFCCFFALLQHVGGDPTTSFGNPAKQENRIRDLLGKDYLELTFLESDQSCSDPIFQAEGIPESSSFAVHSARPRKSTAHSLDPTSLKK